ncbi:HAD family hydrolase [Nocardioides aurantiacus]|uniref:HAD family hydrolase n=1 Tax=Nocardioides aurantiacus TaxID=86796 RepID=UPI0011CE73DB|nr:HAD family hydrolase [Nocardioides aurantiacus]
MTTSFDVFDTVLTRRVGDPDAVFGLVADRLRRQGVLVVDPHVFALARRRHEGALTRLLGRHATLHEIYSAVAEALVVDEAEAARWVDAEETVERELVVPAPGVAEVVVAARTAGAVIFVSDTPHREAFVKELLLRHGLARESDRVFTSSERGVSKAHGGLFTLVAEQLGQHDVVHHHGDHPRSDVAAARIEGWSSSWKPQGRLNRYERLLEGSAADSAGMTSLIAGASRLSRLEALRRGAPPAQAEVGAGPLGAMLVGFASWVVDQARLRGVRRLYYVARDGESMLAAARPIVTRLAPELELRYLHASRRPWVFGASATHDELLARWVDAGVDYTARTLLARVDLDPSEVYDLVGLDCCLADRADLPLNLEERQQLAGALQSEPLVSEVRRRGRQMADRSIAYLRQEGLADGVPSALVDAGWGGSAAFAVDHLVAQMGGHRLHHFYVGLLGDPGDLARRGSTLLVPWLFDEPRHPHALDRLRSAHTVVETLCAGSVGRTLDYRSVDGRWEPVLESEVNVPVVDWGLGVVHGCAVRTAELVAEVLPPDSAHLDVATPVLELLRMFWVHPTRHEAKVWGAFPWQEEIWLPYAPLAQQLRTRQVVENLWRGEGRLRRVNSWRAGSAEASSEPWRSLLRGRAWHLENREQLRRLPRRLRLEVARRRRSS